MQTHKVLESFISSHALEGRHITLAFSGGADSLSLLILLRRSGLSADAIYVNHNLRSREELEAEIELNQRNAALLGVPLKVVTLPRGAIDEYASSHGTTLEAAARALRYEVLERESRDLIATAHTFDDQVETLFMRLLSGSSLQALAGIREVRGRIIRPILSLRREETVRICKEAGLQYASDSSNDTLFCRRNQVRKLVKLTEGEKESLVNIAGNISTFLRSIPPVPLERGRYFHTFSRSALLGSHPIAAEALTHEIYALFTGKLVSRAESDEIITAVRERKAVDGRYFHLRLSGDEVRIHPRFPYFATPFSIGASLPHGLKVVSSDDEKALRIDPSHLSARAVLRLAESDDLVKLKDHTVKAGSLLSSYHVPYAIVLEDEEGVAALFSAPFGGRDRIRRGLRSSSLAESGIRVL